MVRPWLLLPPYLSHQLGSSALSALSSVSIQKKPPKWRSFQWKNLYFPNPVGPAGGVDKSARQVRAWWALGAGVIEAGTITLKAQKANPGPILKRNTQKEVLWNFMGFPNEGALKTAKRLKTLQSFKPTPVFANIGKSRHTPLSKAYQDYVKCIDILHPYVDAFVINISSPNTEGLMDLSQPSYLTELLTAIGRQVRDLDKPKHFFVKWSPDMKEDLFLKGLDIANGCGAGGHIICNTSRHLNRLSGFFPNQGGLSGRFLAGLSKDRLKIAHKHLSSDRNKYLLISVGGVMSAEDVGERLDMGADLVQCYSALVFKGPGFFLSCKKIDGRL